jgi:hypothetical protein
VSDIDCSDINSLAQSNSSVISNFFDEWDQTFPTINLKENAPDWQTRIVDYVTQLETTREQKQLLDGEICSLFIDTIRSVSTQKWVQLGSGILLFLLAYSIMYVPLLVICYLLALLLRLGLSVWIFHVTETKRMQKNIR